MLPFPTATIQTLSTSWSLYTWSVSFCKENSSQVRIPWASPSVMPSVHLHFSSSHWGFLSLLLPSFIKFLSHKPNEIVLIRITRKINFTKSYSQFSFIILLDLLTFGAVGHVQFLEQFSFLFFRHTSLLWFFSCYRWPFLFLLYHSWILAHFHSSSNLTTVWSFFTYIQVTWISIFTLFSSLYTELIY